MSNSSSLDENEASVSKKVLATEELSDESSDHYEDVSYDSSSSTEARSSQDENKKDKKKKKKRAVSQPSPRKFRAFGAAIEECKLAVLGTQEVFKRAWDVLFINQWNKEQERVMLLTDRNLYRVKFDVKKGRVVHYQRVDICDIDMIHRGFLYVEGALKSDKQSPKTYRNGRQMYGMRVFAGRVKNTSKFSKDQYCRTYAALNPDGDGRGDINDIVDSIVSMRDLRTGDRLLVTEVDLIVKNTLPGVSGVYNRFGLGLWKKSGKKK